MGKRRRLTILGPGSLALLILAPLLAISAATTSAQSTSPEQRLAEQYAPVAYLRAQSHACDRDGEGYFPAPVETVLGNPEVALKRDMGGASSVNDPIIKMAPTGADLANLGADFYLDFPGNPRRAGCTYERDFKRFASSGGYKPTAYARIVVDKAEERVILQYWLWYYFNDWNNTHESDWEMIQLVFAAPSVEGALRQAPLSIGYAQHGGGELSAWDDEDLRVENGRPVIYPAAGSHATYFGQKTYLGWGENGTGFGCDHTTAPGIRTPLEVVLVPDQPSLDDQFGWLSFSGRWGERQPWEFNGPFGPNTGTKWDNPLRAMATWREYSLGIPGSSNTLGPSSTEVFCGMTAFGSEILITFGTNPELLVAATILLGILIAYLFVSRWRELARAFGVYRRHLRVFLGIGVFTIPIGIAFNLIAVFARDVPPMEWLVKWFNDTANAWLFTAATIGGLQQAGMILVIAPPVIQAMQEIRAGRDPGIIDCFRAAYGHARALVLAVLLVYGVIGALLLVVVGIPVAFWLSVRWQFFAQATVLDDAETSIDAVRGSSTAIAGHWWQALGRTLVFQAMAVLPGPLIGIGLLLLGKTSVQFANSLSSVAFAITVPVSVIGLTMAYEEFTRGRDGLGRHTSAHHVRA